MAEILISSTQWAGCWVQLTYMEGIKYITCDMTQPKV